MKKLRSRKIASWILTLALLFSVLPIQKVGAAPQLVGTGPVVIYEAYGGGGNGGAIFKSDFIVLKNISKEDVNLEGWSIQYASAKNPFTTVEPLTGIVKAGKYFVIEGATGTNVDLPAIPKTDILAPAIKMSGTTFKLALCNNQVKVETATLTETDLVNYPGIVDYLGVGKKDVSGFLGTAAVLDLSNGTSAIRKAGPDSYTGDNSLDFEIHTPDLSYLVEQVKLHDPVSDEDLIDGAVSLDKVYLQSEGTVTTVGQVAYIYGGNSIILQDRIDGEIMGIQIYDFPNIAKYKIGDVVRVSGTVSVYGGVHQIGTTTEVVSLRAETPFEPQVVTLKELNENVSKYLSEFVYIKDVTLGAWSEKGSTPITDPTGSMVIYRTVKYPVGVAEGSKVDLQAAMSKNNATNQLRLGSASDYIVTVDTVNPIITLPTFLPAKAHKDYSFGIDVVDNVGVKSVHYTYTINGVVSEQIKMDLNETTGKYQATVPGDKITGTDKIVLNFYAEDVNGLKAIDSKEISVEDKPQIISVTPAANSSTDTVKRPEFKVEFENAGLAPEVMLSLNGETPVKMTVTGNIGTYQPTSNMKDGKVNASVVITREDKVVSEAYEWVFFIGEPLYNFYFGQLHSHTNYSDGSGTPDQALTYASKAEQIDFLALTDHSNYFDTTANLSTFDKPSSGIPSAANPAMSKWEYYKSVFDNYATDDFLPIYGFEMTWSGQYGHMNTFNSNGIVSRNDPALNAKNGAGLKAYYELLKKQDGAFSQFNHPGTTFGTFMDFGFYDRAIDDKVNLIEVGNGEGPIRGSGYFPSYQYYNLALDKGWHLAPSNNQDNHKGKWGDANTARTVAIADSLTKESIFDAIDKKMVYATEDNNFEILYTLNDNSMGTTISDAGEKVNIVVDLNDPDAQDVIGKVSVVVNGGIIAHSEMINSNAGTMNITLPNDYSYYYIKVEQADGDIAVTAPVWTGDVTQVGINDMTKDTSMDVKGEATNLTTHLFNYETNDFVLTKVEYLVDGKSIKVMETDLPTIKQGTVDSLKYAFIPEKLGKQTVTVNVLGTLLGVPMAFTKSIELNVYDGTNVVEVLVDAAHDNFYVSGDYAGNDSYFTTVAGEKGVRIKRNNVAFTKEALEGISLLILTVPFSGFGKDVKNYTEEEVKVIQDYANSGGNIMITSKSDRGNSANVEMKASEITNRILTAVGAKARIGDGIIVDNIKKSNEAYRIQFMDDECFIEDSRFGHGILTNTTKTFNAYNSAPVIPNGATTVVQGYESTWGANYTANFTSSAYVPDYEKDMVVVEKGKVSMVTEETLPGGGFLVAAGVTFFTNFEVTVEMLVEESVRNANFQILNNILDAIKPEKVITPIKEVQAAEEGLQFTIEGRLTSNASGFDKNTAFFDSGYVQDETGGINIFPIAGNYQEGQLVQLTGITSSYQGEHQLNISEVKLINEPIVKVEPTVMTTAEVPNHLGLLVKVEGLVRKINMANDLVESIIIEDESGVATRVFIDGYIGLEVVMPELLEGDRVSAIGLSSIDPLGNRIRVRDRAEIKLVAKAVDKAALEDKLKEAKTATTDGMTKESINTLTEAIKDAEAVMADEFVSQEKIDAALATLETALNGLAKEADPDVKPGDEVKTPYTLVDEKTGISVNVPVDAFVKVPVLVVKEVKHLIEGFETLAYDIYFTVDGVKTLPKTKVLLSIPVKNLDQSNLYLLHQKNDGKFEQLKYTLKNKKALVETKDFSMFVLASGKGKLPAAGAANSLIFYFMGISMIAGGVVMTGKKRRLN